MNRAAALEYTGFWIGRLQFSLDYINGVQILRRGGKAEMTGDKATAIAEMEQAIATMRHGIEAYAGVARNPTDVGTIVLVNEHSYRALKVKLEELKA